MTLVPNSVPLVPGWFRDAPADSTRPALRRQGPGPRPGLGRGAAGGRGSVVGWVVDHFPGPRVVGRPLDHLLDHRLAVEVLRRDLRVRDDRLELEGLGALGLLGLGAGTGWGVEPDRVGQERLAIERQQR